jgi:hypothetical protein
MLWCFLWKDSCLHALEVPVLMGSPEVVNERPLMKCLGLTPSGGPPLKNPLVQEPPFTYTRDLPHQCFFNLNFLMEPGWGASLGRFQLNFWHYSRSRAVKTVASRDKCDDISVMINVTRKMFSIAF